MLSSIEKGIAGIEKFDHIMMVLAFKSGHLRSRSEINKLLIQYLCHIDVTASVDFDLARFDAQGLVERHGFQVIDRDLRSECDHVAQLVHLTHRFVEDGCDDAAMAVARGARIALAQAEAADEAVVFFVVSELQVHAVGIVLPAAEAEILL